MRDHEGGNLAHQAVVRGLVLEGGTEFRPAEGGNDLLADTACQIDPPFAIMISARSPA